MTDSERRLLAVFVAAHAVAETRMGPPYEIAGITDGAQWTEPERPLQWSSSQEASELLVRLSVGYLALLRFTDADSKTASSMAARDLEGIADVLERLRGARPNEEEVAARARENAQAFLDDEANAHAVVAVTRDLVSLGWLDMHEVDFLVEAADGDGDALDDLERYRASFSSERIPWPAQT